MAESFEYREQLARLDADMQHLKENFSELKEEFRDQKRETKADLAELRQETRQGFAEVKQGMAEALHSLGDRIDTKIEAINEHVNTCSKTNGQRLANLENDHIHAKGVTRGAVAVISLVAAGLGAVVAALIKAYL